MFTRCTTLIAVGLLTLTGIAAAQQPLPPLKEDTPGLLKQAKITPDSARKVALARVPGGVIAEQSVEQEHGKLVFSFDIKVPGKTGVEEVQVDARTGAFVSQEHEDPAHEAKEKAADKAKETRKP